MPELGTLQRQDPRAVWPNEAHDFTPWLAEHLDQLGAAIEMDLELVRRESDAGDFSIDLLARDLGRDRFVVIENQLTPTDHRHLGQSITYAAHADAGVVVWVCREFREEHRAALDWLNRGLSATTEFYGVVVEVLQIDKSRPAVNFRVVAAPAGRSSRRSAPGEDQEPSDKGHRYRNFFQRLIDSLREKHHFTNARAGQPQSWYSFSSGVRGFVYGVNFPSGGRMCTELYIDGGDEDWNLEALRALREQSADIEREFGEKLDWQEMETKRACRIALYRKGSIMDPQDKLDEYMAWAIEHVLKLKRVFDPRIRKIARPAAAEQAT